MPSNPPLVVTRKRGLKGALLRHLPNTWFEEPGARQVQIPRFSTSPAGAPDVEWYAAPAIGIAFVWDACRASEDVCDWQIAVSVVGFGPFSVSVLGTGYRSCIQSAAGDEDPVAQAGPVGEQIPPPNSSRSPYAHLYDLLYPLPEEVIADQIPLPDALHPYQRVGIEFLVTRHHALLADDMGLGKTAQCVLALAVLRRTERVNRCLIICPRAVIRQWQHEADRWAGLRVTVVDGPPADRRRLWRYAPGVLLTTPNIVLNDSELVKQWEGDQRMVADDRCLPEPPCVIRRESEAMPD